MYEAALNTRTNISLNQTSISKLNSITFRLKLRLTSSIRTYKLRPTADTSYKIGILIKQKWLECHNILTVSKTKVDRYPLFFRRSVFNK